VEHVAPTGEMRNGYKISVGNPKGIPWRRWEDKITTVGRCGVNSIALV
jgi:hypothetical protein